MTYMMMRGELADYDAWKPMFDEDPVGREKMALGHRLYRGVENPNEIIIQVEFAGPDEARSFRERLVASGMLERFAKTFAPPLVVEQEEMVTYARQRTTTAKA